MPRHKAKSWKRLCRFGILALVALFAACTAPKASFQAALPSTETSFATTSYHPTANTSQIPLRQDAVGGGFADAGLTGEYFANSNLSGRPAFVRQDVRIDFDWKHQSPGGSTSEPYKSFPKDNFSARWTGQLLPRFSETYTFTTTADNGIRLYIKEPSQAGWTNVINQWSTTANKPNSKIGKFPFVANKAYDIKVEYRDLKGPALARVEWSSPSTPKEVIGPASGIASNVYVEGFADIMKTARDQWLLLGTNEPAPRDVNGWPTADASSVVSEGGKGNLQGNYFLQFNGKADVNVFGGKLSDYKYNAATNTSTAIVIISDSQPINLVLAFKNTYRDANSGPNTGITNIKLMRPTAVGATTSYAPTTIFTTTYKNLYHRFIALRSMGGTNWNNSVDWSDRTLATYSTQHKVNKGESGFEGNSSAWEYKVMLANELGKDLYINIPETANDDYITKLAQLLKYGSDGTNPYTNPEAQPIFPPLNPNLRVYVEYSNEVWNVGFDAWHQNYNAAQQAVNNNTLEGQIITYDGTKDANTLWNRRHALRVLEASNLFRRVFGDAAMNRRVRFLLEWQYDNQGWPPTTETQLQFLNDYFNNGDGKQHVTTPQPIQHYLWGGGGATYYKAENEDGAIPLPNNTTWNFLGAAGMVNYSKFLDGIELPQSPKGKQPKELPSTTAELASLQGAGTASIRVTFPATATSNVYGVKFYAVQPKQADIAENAAQRFDIYLDNTKINQQKNPKAHYQIGNRWNKYYSNTFTVEPGSTHTIRFVGDPQSMGTVLLHQLQLTSVDAIFKSAFPTSDYQNRLDVMANWAHLYGLNNVAYEGGWALGGDAGGSPIQNWAKYNDPRAKQVQLRSINSFYKAGGRIYSFGTYSQWDDWQNAAHEPLVEGIDQSNRQLPPEPTNGVTVPGNLTQNNKVTAWGPIPIDTGKDGKLGPRTIMNWNIIVPNTGRYKVTVNSAPGGQVLLLVDGAMTVISGSSGSSSSGNVMLTKGLHTVWVKATNGSFNVTGVNVSSA